MLSEVKTLNKPLIHVAENFGASVNLNFDLHDLTKIDSFIPTTGNLSIIETLLSQLTDRKNHQPNILIGPYGKGKSHTVLVFLQLISRLNDKSFSRFDNTQINNFISTKKRYLPVIINGSNPSIEANFIQALQSTLKQNNLSNLFPKNSYSYAVDIIEKWESDFPDAYIYFSQLLREKTSPEEIKEELKSFNSTALNIFTNIFPKITSGAEFNPFNGSDFIQLYDEILDNLKKKGYSGIYIVYDEFSKYLENNIGNSSQSDTKLLQDFAEKCERSNGDINLLLIGHKSFNNYINSNLPKYKIDGWRGISGRFNELNLHNSSTQMYEIISQVILKNDRQWKKFQKLYNNQFKNLKNSFEHNKLFSELVEKIDRIIIKGCYPLHPVTTFILPRLSELIAQNERTMFTFLSGHGINTLSDILEHTNLDEFIQLTPDVIYDYFEKILANEPDRSPAKNIYILSSSIIEDLQQSSKNSLKIKIIKSIALIYIVNQFERLKPIRETIINIFINENQNALDVDQILESLINDNFLIYERYSDNFLTLKQNYGIDIENEIKKIEERIKLSSTELLQKYSPIKYLFPVSYNDDNHITRYFKIEYIDSAKNKPDILMDSNDADGIVKLYHKINITSELRKLEAATILLNAIKTQSKIKQQVQDVIDDLSKFVTNTVNEYFNGILYSTAFSEKLSKKCRECYINYPVINNELINKNIITGTTKSSSSKIIDYLLTSKLEYGLPSSWTNQEKFIFYSTLVKTNLLKEYEEKEGFFKLQNQNADNKKYFAAIKTIISDIKKHSDLEQIYSSLQSQEFGYGIRKSVIPIYITIAILQMTSIVNLIKGKEEIQLNGYEFNEIENFSSDYKLVEFNYNTKQQKYIDNLEFLFSDFIVYSDKQFGQFFYLIKAMLRWKLALPKWSLEFTESSFLDNLDNAQESPSNFLFRVLPKLYNVSDYKELTNKLSREKDKIDSALNNLYSTLIKDITSIFSKNTLNLLPLLSTVELWLDGLNVEQKEYLYDGIENLILEVLENSKTEKQLIDKLARITMSLSPRDWGLDHPQKFITQLTQFRDSVLNIQKNNSFDYGNTGAFEIIQIEKNGSRQIRRVAQGKISPRAQLLKNEIETALNEMGRSISEQEKRLVLLEFLKKMI
jgi:hypothetical protein